MNSAECESEVSDLVGHREINKDGQEIVNLKDE